VRSVRLAGVPERLDLGTCEAIRHDRDPGRCVLLLPGQFYPTRAPLLWFAREAAVAHGWSALEVLGEPGLHPDPLAWERECAERALGAAGDARVTIIGKSLASFLADLVNERHLAAVWLTPVLTNSAVVGALARADRPTLLVGGTADRLWDQTAIPNNKALEVLELDGADHSLQVPSQPIRSLDALRQVTDSVGHFLTRLGDPKPEQPG
jgi:pimeloyl-ACP methyl ester carboxylesterase